MSFTQLMQNPPHFFAEQGQKMALDAFKKTASRVPAYQDFLQKHGVNPDQINTIDDFRELPLIDKNNYFRAYPLEELCLDGNLHQMHSLTATSGSTGEPCYIPLIPEQEAAIAPALEALLCEFCKIEQKSTLLLITFALGASSTGMLAATACRKIACNPNYPMKGTSEIGALTYAKSFPQRGFTKKEPFYDNEN